jgi:PAS domain S-box-containing protein
MLLIDKIYAVDVVETSPVLYECLTRQTVFNVEVRYHYSKTDTRWLQFSTQPRHEGDWVVCEGFILDITARKRAEIELAVYLDELELMVKERTDELEKMSEELAASVETIWNFIHQSIEGISITDIRGRIIEWNHAIEKITGIKKEDVIGKYTWDVIWSLLAPERRTAQALDELHRAHLEYIESGYLREPAPEEMTYHVGNGVIRRVLVSRFPIKMAHTRYFGRILHDITHQWQTDMELSRYHSCLEEMVEAKTCELTIAKEKAEESERLKSAFLNNISHEIRTPLNAIVGLLNTLGEGEQLSDNVKELVGIINRNSEELLRLIDDILDMAKIEAGQMTIQPKLFCVDNLMDEMQIFYENYIRTNDKTHIRLETINDRNAAKCMIYTDPERLKQILHHLLNNAIKFTDEGYIHFGYRRSGTKLLEFFVKDSGVGIPENQLENIFQLFRQTELDNTRRYGGTGLGLPISRSLTQLMGGDMRVKSTERKGSTFIFTVACHPCVIT